VDIQLTGRQQEEFEAALVEAFDEASLRRMISHAFNKPLGALAGGHDRTEIVFNLIEKARMQGWIGQLIVAARQANSGNPRLLTFAQQFDLSSIRLASGEDAGSTTSVSYTWKFDLDLLVEECADALEGKRGLIGLGMPCNADWFPDNFCERLRDELGRKPVLRRPLGLKPIMPPAHLLKIMRTYKPALQTSDILCPVLLQVYDEASARTISARFWSVLAEEFRGDMKHRLIVILFTDLDNIFPDGMVRLSLPVFKASHASRWIGKVVERLGWPPDAGERWKAHMIQECRLEPDPVLHIQFVYEHLDYALRLLQSHPSADLFLMSIAERSQYSV